MSINLAVYHMTEEGWEKISTTDVTDLYDKYQTEKGRAS